jgi:hypothetical protein
MRVERMNLRKKKIDSGNEKDTPKKSSSRRRSPPSSEAPTQVTPEDLLQTIIDSPMSMSTLEQYMRGIIRTHGYDVKVLDQMIKLERLKLLAAQEQTNARTISIEELKGLFDEEKEAFKAVQEIDFKQIVKDTEMYAEKEEEGEMVK